MIMMKINFITIFLFILFTFTNQSTTNVSVNELTNAIGVPPCMKKCMNSLIGNLYEIFTNDSIKNVSSTMCNEYNKFVNCTIKYHKICPYEKVYNIIFEGFYSFCHKRKIPHSPCLDEKVNTITDKCNKNCKLISQLDDIFQRRTVRLMATYSGNPILFVENLSEFCESLSCFFSCFKNNLKKECKKDGHEFLIHMVKPFYSLIDIVRKYPSIKHLIQKKIPKTCHFVFNRALLDMYSKY
uniref:CPG4 domain-containing protein n=1 Tax=Parastrongyloides trichosuri TaxID=131310 RepID=A0A0N4ZV83_PARTI